MRLFTTPKAKRTAQGQSISATTISATRGMVVYPRNGIPARAVVGGYVPWEMQRITNTIKRPI